MNNQLKFNMINPILNPNNYAMNNPMRNNFNSNEVNNLNNINNIKNINYLNINNQMPIIQNEKHENNNLNLNINQNTFELLNIILNFYKNNNNKTMTFDYPNQIKGILKLINLNNSCFKYKNNIIEDPLYYIQEPKKIIKFVNSNYIIQKVKIPLLISKNDLYSIAFKYKYFNSISNILLIHNNKLLSKDESSINDISENDSIIIIEPRNYPDESYNIALNKKNSNNKINVIFFLLNGKKINMVFPNDVKISEINISFCMHFGLDINFFNLFYNGEKLEKNDDRQIKIFTKHNTRFIINENHSLEFKYYLFGKEISYSVISNDENAHGTKYIIGILNSVNDIIIKFESLIRKEVIELIIGGTQISKNEKRSLLSLGITKDFDCYIGFGKSKK